LDTKKIASMEMCQDCINRQISFVLQGGAGSGKTELLKDLLLNLHKNKPSARVVCITHTNNAVHEIKARIGDKYYVSTIHAFIHNLIKKYKHNIHNVIPALYMIPMMIASESGQYEDEKHYKKAEYERYKKIYSKFANKLYSIRNEFCDKVTGKKAYDSNPSLFNDALNAKIHDLNEFITGVINANDYDKIHYNETKFDSLSDLTYGHDGLLSVFHLLFEKYPVLGKIIKDKYDYIFIDEYQDTNTFIVQDFLALTKQKDRDKRLTLCLFGDAMQAIYSDGIGNVGAHISCGDLTLIPKPDNYRCSYEIIDLINPLRLDDIKQKVAFARSKTGELQSEADRHGNARVLFAVCDHRPNSHSSADTKQRHLELVDQLIDEAAKGCLNPKILMLTNKAIAEKEGFKELYKVFDDRYVEVSDRMENYLNRIQVSDIFEICSLYSRQIYNPLIKMIRSSGYVIHTQRDKIKLIDTIGKLLNDNNYSLYEAFQYAEKNKLIKISETCQNILNANSQYLHELASDNLYQEFKKLYLSGLNTFTRIRDSFSISSEEEFDYYKALYNKERFIETLFSKSIKFVDALNYFRYLNENSNYVTMHKTKGSSIDSVIVVMEEFYWNQYDFSLLYSDDYDEDLKKKREDSQKLIYVACSRARKSLSCIRLLLGNEVDKFKAIFPNAEEVNLATHI